MPHRHVMTRRGLIVAVVLALIILLLALSAPASAFPDVPAGHPYGEAITALSTYGIIGGYANGYFGVNDPVKRAQFAKMVVGSLGIVPSASVVTRFTDLGMPDAYGYPHIWVQTAYDHGITYGTDAAQTLFAPWNPIRRDQMVSMIVRGIAGKLPDLIPALLPSLLSTYGLTAQAGTTSLFDGVGEPHGLNLRVAEAIGLLNGLVGLGPNWSIQATATRGEVAQMLYNVMRLLQAAVNPPPTTPPPTTPSGDIWVYSDGSGTYQTIEAAIGGVKSGTTIYLGTGTFTLTRTMEVGSSLRLVGKGMQGSNGTTIKYAGPVVEVSDTAFSAEGIRFVCTATSGNATVLTAEDADIELNNCWFTGGNNASGQGGDGLYLHGSTTGTVTGCVATLNDMTGIAVDDDADVTLDSNDCSDNGSNGIGFWGRSTGHVRGNTCDSNADNGIAGNDDSKVTAEDNECSENGGDGIGLWEDAAGEATGNTCDSNDYNGIAADDNADLTAKENRCWYNGSSGIGFYGSATGLASNNTCDLNDYSGVALVESASATVALNECSKNKWNGVGCWNEAVGLIRWNTCNSNGYDGIYAGDSTEVQLENNECSENVESGIWLEEYVDAVAIKNVCDENGYDGISCHDSATLDLEQNICRYNMEDGIRFSENCSGYIIANTCSYSQNYHGISIHDNASAIVNSNGCYNNYDCGIWFGDYATGSASDNECSGNYYGIYVDATANPVVYTDNWFHNNVIDYHFA